MLGHPRGAEASKPDITAVVKQSCNKAFSLCETNLNLLLRLDCAADKSMAADMAGARHIDHNVRAYIKVQRKQVSEAAGKELIRTLVLKSEDHFEALLKSGLAEYAQNIKEPQRIARERDNLHTRKQVLQRALDLAEQHTRTRGQQGKT